jgi:hypothetical protein
MPASVREKYRHDLVGEGAQAHLFERDVAWHRYMKGCRIIWHGDTGEKSPEFTVVTDTFEFEVERKRIGVDAFRRIRRRDFYHLFEALLPEVSSRGLAGKIDLVLLDRLPGNRVEIRNMAHQILQRIGSGGTAGQFSLNWGHVIIDVREGSNERVDLQKMHTDLMLKKPHEAHGAIFARSDHGSAVISQP